MEPNVSNQQEVHRDVYSIVTDRIIDLLNKGTVPWRQPWMEAGVPRNLISQRPYRGINVLLLASLGYEQNSFLTYKQLKEAGGTVNQGEKAHIVVFWNFVEKNQDESESNGRKKVPYLRYSLVYNVAQCSGVANHLTPFDTTEREPIAACEKIVCGMPKSPVLQHKEQKAWYNPVSDVVNMPKLRTFTSSESYYVTLFHELVHSTGHISRLNRKDLLQMTELGSEQYSHEELVAEIGACYLQSLCGITTELDQSAGYIQGWLYKLQNDKRFIISASAHAQRAIDFICNVKSETVDINEGVS